MVDTTGWSVRNKANPYFAKANHVKLAKNQATKRFIDSVVDQFLVVRALLFSSNEPGFFYDFDDWSTLFQDTAGTQPVTAANQGVALALDKRLGLELGPELVTNGTFDENIDGWTNSTPSAGNISFSAGQLLVERVSGGTSAYQALACVVGYTYQVLFNFTSVVSGLPRISATSNAGTPGSGVTDPQATRFVFVATATTMYIHLGLNSGNGTSGSYDNISVRELKGNHATQATTAARPLTVIHPDGGVRNLYLGDSDLLQFGSPTAATVTTVTQSVGSFTQVAEIEATGTGSSFAERISINSTSEPHCFSAFVPDTGSTTTVGFVDDVSPGIGPRFNPTNGTFTNSGGTISTTATPVTGGWLVEIVYLRSGGVYQPAIWVVGFATSSIGLKVRVAGVQFERGTSRSHYQRTFGRFDVTEAGKRSIRRLYFNGASHFLQTPTITPNTDKAQVFAGLRKLSDAEYNWVVSLRSPRSTNGTFAISASLLSGLGEAGNRRNWGIELRGTIRAVSAILQRLPRPAYHPLRNKP
jgi:hypothetical protein